MHRYLAHIFAGRHDAAGPGAVGFGDAELPARDAALQDGRRHRQLGDGHRAGRGLRPGAALVDMQIEQVVVETPPTHGTLVLAGPGFRYFANLDDQKSADRFTLVVSGKNRHDRGKSTVEVIVGRPLGYMASSLIEWCDNCRT
jgi:hypothetical protein